MALETLAAKGLVSRSLDVLAETDFRWTDRGYAEDVYLCEAMDARTRPAGSVPQIKFRADGSLLDLQMGQSGIPTMMAGHLVMAVMLNMVTRRGCVADLRARAIVAAGDCEDEWASLVSIEPHVAMSKAALRRLHRELHERDRPTEVRLQTGAPFWLRGLTPRYGMSNGRSDRQAAPRPAKAGDVSIDMGIVVVSSREDPAMCMRAVGTTSVVVTGFEMTKSRRVLEGLAG